MHINFRRPAPAARATRSASVIDDLGARLRSKTPFVSAAAKAVAVAVARRRAVKWGHSSGARRWRTSLEGRARPAAAAAAVSGRILKLSHLLGAFERVAR